MAVREYFLFGLMCQVTKATMELDAVLLQQFV